MANMNYTVPATYVLENISDKAIKVQLYRVNLLEEICAGDGITVSCDSSEECVYYQNLALSFGVDEDGVPNVLHVYRAE